MSSVILKTGPSTSITFDVAGTANLALFETYAARIDSATNFTTLPPLPAAHTPTRGLTVYQIQNSQAGSRFAMNPNGGYLEDLASGPSTVFGSGAGDSVIVADPNAGATLFEPSGNNLILFAEGNNRYVGGSGNNSIVGGSGSDAIYTGTGNATINAGTGQDTIWLNDTASGSSAANDLAYLDQGHALVLADGMFDGVVANAPGQTIVGGSGLGTAASTLSIVLNAGNGLTATSQTNDIVGTGAANAALFDFTSGNTIYGGTGSLYFVPGPSITAALVGALGSNILFGSAGDSIDFYAQSSQSSAAILVAGSGNETLNAGASAGDVNIWAYAGDSTNPMTDQSIAGGAGNDIFFTGSGNETLAGGGGSNLFYIQNDTAYTGPTHILLQDFGSSSTNQVAFLNYAPSLVQDALDNATVSSTGLTLALGATTIIFAGVQNLNGKIA